MKAAALGAWTLLVLAAGTPAHAAGEHWEPAGIRETSAALENVLAARDAAAGRPLPAYARRVEHWRLTAGEATLETVVSVRDGDLRFQTSIADAAYSQGRADGVRWRETPNGLVRRIGADVQGDDLDRWPLGIFPYAAADCRLLGETEATPRRYVVEYRPAHDSPHWFFYDAAGGQLTNELEREGSRSIAFAFAGFRRIDGVLRPFAWQVSGAGGAATVAVDDVAVEDVPAAAVERPASRSDALAAFDGQSVDIPATFRRDRILLDARVNGRLGRFIVDTGTTQILIDEGAARRFGIETVLGHGVAHDLSMGPVHFKDLAVQTASLAAYKLDGILGYDFFAGHIVHLDYGRGRLDFERRDGFAPPADAGTVPVNFDEGMPLATATAGTLGGSRFALDTGSRNAVFLHHLFEGESLGPSQLGFRLQDAISTIHFLEGAITVQDAELDDLGFAGFDFKDSAVQLEVPGGDLVDFPIDGILGTNLLARYEWWFDYDGGRCWLRPLSGRL